MTNANGTHTRYADSTHKIHRYIDSTVWSSRKFPPSLHIALTDHCWNKCKVCGHHQRPNKTKLNMAQLENLLKYAAMRGLETVCFTGGDPLCYPHINEAMGVCQALDIDYGIVTAGYCPPWVSLRLLAKARWVRCSVDAADEEQYAAVRGGMTWRSVKSGMKEMHKYGANLQVFTTLSSYNELALNKLFGWLLGYREMFSELRARPVYKSTDEAAHLTNIRLTTALLNLWTKRFKDAGIATDFTAQQFDPKPIQRCTAVKYQLFIGAGGGVYPCCITAGDTEAASRVEPFGNIERVPQDPDRPDKHWQQCLRNIDKWAWLASPTLPQMCREECAPRFNAINTTLSNNLLAEKNFF